MNVIYFTGNVGRDPELRSVRDDKVCNFSVAVKQGYAAPATGVFTLLSAWRPIEQVRSHNAPGAPPC